MFQQLLEFEIWCEGYAATGERGQAMLMGRTMAHSFKEACDNLLTGSGAVYNSEHGTYWGCRLFDNETAARASFG